MATSDKVQLYSLATPNGVKISVALEEMGIPYEPHTVDIMNNEQYTDSFKAISPASKIPAIVDPQGPGGKPLNVFESGAILLYLAERSGKFLPTDPVQRLKTLEWLFFQVGSGPYFGQLGHFYKYAPEKVEYGINRYVKESKRYLEVIEEQLKSNQYIAGDEYTIADMALFPWLACLDVFYGARDVLELSNFKAIDAYMKKIMRRDAVQRGIKVCTKEGMPLTAWRG